MADSVLVFCAHPDDEVFGPGGTVAKYAQEGKSVRAVIFTYGYESHPWQKEEITREVRIRESRKAASVLGYKRCIFLGLDEGKILKQVEETNVVSKILKLIEKYKPDKIFTHSLNDPHPDHKAVHRVMRAIVSSLDKPIDLYAFDIWTFLSLRERGRPQLLVDITDTFGTKVKALKCFKSQQISLLSLLWSVWLKAFINGLKNDCKCAENFYKIPLDSSLPLAGRTLSRTKHSKDSVSKGEKR